jgi:hypothetical protein
MVRHTGLRGMKDTTGTLRTNRTMDAIRSGDVTGVWCMRCGRSGRIASYRSELR